MKKCAQCRITFSASRVHLDKRKFCSVVCYRTARWSAFEHKKYVCKFCQTNNIGRKAKHCRGCRFVKNKTLSKCAFCGRETLSFPCRPKKFCSKKCQMESYNGKGNPHWMGGITKPNKKIRASKEYAVWRESVFVRDNYTCVLCGQIGGTLNADHIKPFSVFTELRFDINNGRTLCLPCHKKTPTYLKGRSKSEAIR